MIPKEKLIERIERETARMLKHKLEIEQNLQAIKNAKEELILRYNFYYDSDKRNTL